MEMSNSYSHPGIAEGLPFLINYYAWVRPSDMEKKKISKMKNISAEGDLFKIEIEKYDVSSFRVCLSGFREIRNNVY
jgi:hypothetical protein